jgi:hypothetical protein
VSNSSNYTKDVVVFFDGFYKDENFDYVSKNIYHALRILDFGKQIKDNGSIIQYSSLNSLKDRIYEEDCNPKHWLGLFMDFSNKLK